MPDHKVNSPKWRWLVWLPALGMGGCSSVADNRVPELLITSTPTGAEVRVMGERVGVTPLRLPSKAVFPATYPQEQQSLYGRVRINHPGCALYEVPVSNKALEDGLHAKLQCDSAEAPASSVPLGARERLKQLEDLKREGLIDEQEYRQTRQRIIESL